MNRRISVAFQTDKPLAAYGPLAQTVEEYGFGGVSVYNDMLFQPEPGDALDLDMIANTTLPNHDVKEVLPMLLAVDPACRPESAREVGEMLTLITT